MVIDIHMPGLDGIEARRRLRLSYSPGRTVPNIALTAHSMNGDHEKYPGQSFDGYVSKPLDEPTLIAPIGKFASVPVGTGIRAAS